MPVRFVVNRFLIVGRPRRVRFVPVVVPAEPEGEAAFGGKQEEVVAAPDVRREGDQAPVRGHRGTRPEGRLLDVEFLVVALPFDAKDPAGPRVVRPVGDGHQEVSRESLPEVRAGIGLDLVRITAPDQGVRPVRAHHPDVETAGLRRGIDDGAAGGGPRVEVHRGMAGEAFGRPARAGHPPDVQIPAGVAGEDHRLAVGRPVRLEVVGGFRVLRPAGQLAGFPARRGHHPEPPVESERDFAPVGGPGGVRRPRRDAGHEVVLDPNLSSGHRRIA